MTRIVFNMYSHTQNSGEQNNLIKPDVINNLANIVKGYLYLRKIEHGFDKFYHKELYISIFNIS